VLFFTADEHYGHRKIREYSNRPFGSVEEMDRELIARHNTVVSSGDVVFHLGDFSFEKTESKTEAKYISELNGTHLFLRGDHDGWLPHTRGSRDIQTIQVNRRTGEFYPQRSKRGKCIVMSHYPITRWPLSHYGSWHVCGHVHNGIPSFLQYKDMLIPMGKIYNVGVDANNFFPVSLHQLRLIMLGLPRNPNQLKRRVR